MEPNEAARKVPRLRSGQVPSGKRRIFSPLSAFRIPRSLLWPALVAVALASFYVVTQPGPVDYNDAYDYDHLAKSILQGRYELSDDYKSPPLPTMQREPGYPAFRAAVYAVAPDRPDVILWVQALLVGITVLLTGLTVRRLDKRWTLPVAWLVALYPGFAVWAGQHYSEIFAAFLAALASYAWVRLWEAEGDGKQKAEGVEVGERRAVSGSKTAIRLPLTEFCAASFGLLLGALSLTRASFQVLPIFAAGLLIAGGQGIALPLRSRRARWKQTLLVIVGFLIVVAPWVMRNGRTFGQYSITYRIGIILHMRALEAEASWSELETSYGSVLFGEATMLRLFPDTPPIIGQLWKKTWDAKLAHLGNGLRAYESDAIFLSQARKKIFSSPSVFMRFALWSGIDELRLFGLSSPLSPKFGVELIANQEAKEGRLSWSKLGVVWGAHALQFLWWALIVTGFVVLVRARLWRHPSLLFVGYAAVMYAPLDNIPRYAVPILPWVIALIAAAMIKPRVSRQAAGQPRILVLAESLNPSSGWTAAARSLVAELRAQGVDLTVLTADVASKGPLLPPVNGSRLSWFMRQLELWHWMAGQSFDLVHVMAEPYARLWRAFGRVPFILTVHGTFADPAAHGVAAASFRAAIARANRIVAVSYYTQGRIASELQSKTIVIQNGADPEIVNEPYDEVRLHGAPLILSVGALKARKGFDRLISGFAEFARTRPNAELVVIGRDDDPTLRQRLALQVESLGLAAKVRFLGEVSRPALLGWYRACDVFALTPVEDGGFEGFGLVYLEANSFGKPCVGSRDSGARDVIQEGKNGYLAKADDPSDVARALERASALAPDQVRATLQGKAWSDRARSYVSLYETIRDNSIKRG